MHRRLHKVINSARTLQTDPVLTPHTSPSIANSDGRDGARSSRFATIFCASIMALRSASARLASCEAPGAQTDLDREGQTSSQTNVEISATMVCSRSQRSSESSRH
jgi:hypothetical protein